MINKPILEPTFRSVCTVREIKIFRTVNIDLLEGHCRA